MNSTLISSDSGTPLIVLSKDAFPSWQQSQSDSVKNWLSQTSFKGEGLSLIPAEQGGLAIAIFVAKDLSDHFVCGELAMQLPAQQFLLQAEDEYIAAIAFSWAVGCYSFDRYKNDEQALATLAVDNKSIVDAANKYAHATAVVRDLVNTPAGDMMPEHMGEYTEKMAKQFGAKVSQIVGDELLEHNYPTIHAVGRASVHQPRLIDLTWGDVNAPKVTLVGKGVCFDSGGLDLKPAAGMRFMKKDMGGTAHVLGLANLIMANNLPIRLRVLVPAVENAVSGNALRPGDVVTTRKGLTVEIDNTDAEGRLVLCDALCEAENDSPELLIDFATLTGAMRVALGTELPGFFSTSDDVATGLMAAGTKNSDPVWRMPLYSAYKDLLKSQIADMTNCATVPFGGAITAALYLQAFVNDDTDWVHFDVMAWNNRALSGRPIGGEAFGIRSVYDYLAERYQK